MVIQHGELESDVFFPLPADEQFLLERLANASIDIYTMAAVLSRYKVGSGEGVHLIHVSTCSHSHLKANYIFKGSQVPPPTYPDP